MAGRGTRAKKNSSQTSSKNVGTQTSPDRYETERDSLMKELKLLKLEMRILKQGRPSNRILAVADSPPHVVVAVADSPQIQKLPGKGCSCKGKCNSRVCGCNKKQTACTELCKCSHARCENKDPDKENIDAQSPRVPISSGNKTTVNRLVEVKPKKNVREKGAAGPSNKRLEEVGKAAKSLFSPDSSGVHGYRSIRELDGDEALEFSDHGRDVQMRDLDSSLSSPEEKRKIRKTKPKQKKKIQETQTEIEASSGKLQQIQVQETQEAQVNFMINPMKPTHQLMRTPPSRTTSFNRSEIPLPEAARAPSPMPILKTNRSSGFDEPQVDWDEHYAQLVPCKHCKRTFLPTRIQKHETNCKRV